MHHRFFALLFLLLTAPALMAPACTGSDGYAGGTDIPATLTALLCTAEGTPLGYGPAVQGMSIWVCSVEIVEYGCDCPEPQVRWDIVGIPGQALDPLSAADICYENAVAATVDPTLYWTHVLPCTLQGIYTGGPNGPQSLRAFEEESEE